MEKLKKTKILGVVGNILVIISLYCNWVTVTATPTGLSQSALLNGSDRGLTVILSCFSLIVIFAGNISSSFFKGLTNIKMTYISSVVQLLVIINRLIRIPTMQVTDDIKWHFSLGFYLMCAGVILLLIFPCIYKQDNKEQNT